MARPLSIQGPFRALAEAMGGVSGLAEEWGVTRDTIYRWVRGDVYPEPLTRRAVNDWARARKLPVPFPEPKKRAS